MMLSEEELRYIAKDVLDTCKDNECEPTKCPDFGFNISCRDYRNLLDTISAKDKQIQDMQERLDKCKEAINKFKEEIYRMSMPDNRIRMIVDRTVKEALEAIERKEDKSNVEV